MSLLLVKQYSWHYYMRLTQGLPLAMGHLKEEVVSNVHLTIDESTYQAEAHMPHPWPFVCDDPS